MCERERFTSADRVSKNINPQPELDSIGVHNLNDFNDTLINISIPVVLPVPLSLALSLAPSLLISMKL